MKPKEMFAALVVKADMHSLSEAMWLNSAGIGSVEDQWDDFQDEFEKLFGVTWKEAEQLARKFLGGELS